ncbi:MAG: RNA polymerase sigma-70 factor [Thalassobius sp.]|nr:RNA polymerase sigma-70 factor [Thalassovita sp.]
MEMTKSNIYSDFSDDKLLVFIRKDEQAAFLEIYQRYWARLYKYAYNVIQNQPACEDIIQEIFLDLWNRRKELLISNLQAYLYKSVKFQIFKYLRKNEIEQKHLSLINKIQFVNNTEEYINVEELEQLLDKSISQLPEKCREIFYMSRFEQKSYQEIAQKLNISTQTVKNQVSKALKFIRASINSFIIILYILLNS